MNRNKETSRNRGRPQHENGNRNLRDRNGNGTNSRFDRNQDNGGANRTYRDNGNRGYNRYNENSRSSRNEENDRPDRGRYENRNNPGRSQRPRQMGFKALEELIENDNIEEIILALNDERKGFKNLLTTSLSPDMVVLVVHMLAKICESTFNSAKTSLMEYAIRSEFATQVINFVSGLALQDTRDRTRNKYFWKDTDEFWHNIIKISTHFHDLLPLNSCDFTVKLLKAVNFSISPIQEAHSVHISDGIKNDVRNLLEVVQKVQKENETKKETTAQDERSTDEHLEPPDDFRQITVYPTTVEITTKYSPFLRSNVVKGAYRDINTYLDIQYRLLREDFVMPLRYGICEYINDPKAKLQDIKIYHNVRFLNAESVNEQSCYKIQFDFSKKKKSFEYENSKRFMFGSLLCFTEDRFKTLLFGKVVERKVELLQEGQIVVGFNPDVVLPEDIYDRHFLLIESKVYFEPYYQVLNVLKNMTTQNFPMERYIIEVRTDTRPPEYLLKIDPVFYRIERTRFWPLNWGDRQFYGLNDAQSEAFRSALTREFAIIQGPPGTGKTFLGLKIAHTLLENMTAWYKHTPMLVICYTNHALDQFLEGLIPTTTKIIRVGSQSKNKHLNEFNLRNKQKRGSPNPAICQKFAEVRNFKRDIETVNSYLNEIEKYNSVIDFRVFKDIVPDYVESWFAKANDDQIIAWLFGGENSQFKKRKDTANNNDQNRNNINTQQVEEHPLQIEENENNDRENLEIEDEIFENLEVRPLTELVSIKSLNEKINRISRAMDILTSNNDLSPYEYERQMDEFNFLLYTAENELDYLKGRLNAAQLRNLDPPEFVNLRNPHTMTSDDRWKLYLQWLSVYEQHLRRQKEGLTLQFREEFVVYSEMRDIEDTNFMKDALVIGMTTTGAARLNSALQALKCPIVIVEEAAEVLEAHIISALTSHCQHLILIGDHKQLKPSTASYAIETRYKLNISLFQRMVDNDVQCHTLNIQHRMRPEIANLIRPTIYPVLHDHESVTNRPNILGVEYNLFFLDHNVEEEACSENSKKNIHEAKFLIQFAKYLVLNGYQPENIIILAAYLGQMFEMQRERRVYSHLLENVRIAVLDNYQGEESDIVLLSLVRSNKNSKIGFLKIENRVCVALSRARNGFYIMGNMKQLCASSDIWPQIEKTLRQQNAIGPHLTLRCQIHRYKTTNVNTEADFLKLPEGGCELLCEAQLDCGHVCKRLCHVLDREHALYECREPCTKLLCENQDHVCTKLCYQLCGPCCYPVRRELKCGHVASIECHLDPDKYDCVIEVDVELTCGHKTKKPCHMKPEKVKCPFPCDVRVEPCGHACKRNCHVNDDPDHLQYKCMKQCERYRTGCTNKETPHKCVKLCFDECPQCEVTVAKQRTKCNHMYKVACNLDPDTIVCEKPCRRDLPCGHKCKNECDAPCGNCQTLVKKVVPDCNHVIEIECRHEPDRRYCTNICPRLLPCGHECGKKCNEDCRKRCKKIVSCNKPSPCGHIIKNIQCYLQQTVDDAILIANCSKPCNVKLECGHMCSGTCGTCHQGRFHQRCAEKCGVPLVCNHECTIPCREACQPCQKPCSYECKHSKCKKKCGEPCTSCKEKCPRKCEHQNCTKRCGYPCSVPPCTEPCKKKIRCGHPCIGFCGDPCPGLCRICDKAELTEFFFGTEDEDDARFVLLVDCQHILESSGMEQWLETDDDQIKPKVCPKCKTVIKKTQRYSDYTKLNLLDLQKVKKNFYGLQEENQRARVLLANEITHLISLFRMHNAPPEVLVDIEKLGVRLKAVKADRRQNINKMDIAAIRAKIDLFTMLLEPLKEADLRYVPNLLQSNIQFIFVSKCITESIDFISKQQSDDIVLEIDRFYRWLQFERIGYKPYLYEPKVKSKFEEVARLLNNPGRFTEVINNVVKSHLEDIKKATASKIALTGAEKREIVKAMGFRQGHWYKCPNGHPYCIADCGGAVMVSTCNECGAQIGGTSHQLLSTNRVATEMDGARHGAWSEQANMRNYRF